jgi:hypothetical protein
VILEAGQLLAGLALLALQGVALWLAVEAGYWIYCKATGRSY